MKIVKIFGLLLTGISLLYAAEDQKKSINYFAEYQKCIARFAYHHNCSTHQLSDYHTRGSCIEDMHRKYGKECFEAQKKYVDAMNQKAEANLKK